MDDYSFTKIDKVLIFIVCVITIVILFFIWVFGWFTTKINFKTYLNTIL
jgi:cell division protein FtsL